MQISNKQVLSTSNLSNKPRKKTVIRRKAFSGLNIKRYLNIWFEPLEFTNQNIQGVAVLQMPFFDQRGQSRMTRLVKGGRKDTLIQITTLYQALQNTQHIDQ